MSGPHPCQGSRTSIGVGGTRVVKIADSTIRVSSFDSQLRVDGDRKKDSIISPATLLFRHVAPS